MNLGCTDGMCSHKSALTSCHHVSTHSSEQKLVCSDDSGYELSCVFKSLSTMMGRFRPRHFSLRLEKVEPCVSELHLLRVGFIDPRCMRHNKNAIQDAG